MEYTQLLKQSVRIFWERRALWPLGMLAALFGQSDYLVNVNSNLPSSSFDDTTGDLPFDVPDVTTLLEWIPLFIIALVVISLIGWLLSLVVGWWAQGAMIVIADAAARDQALSMGTGLSTSRRSLGRLITLGFLLDLPGVLLGMLALAILLAAAASAFQSSENPERIAMTMLGAAACFLPLILIASLLGVVLHVLNMLAARACVLGELGVRASMSRAWLVIRRTIGYTILTWFLLVALAGGFSLLASLATIPFILVIFQAVINEGWSTIATGAVVGLGIYALLANIVAGGILNSFNATLWTLFYRAGETRLEPAPAAAG